MVGAWLVINSIYINLIRKTTHQMDFHVAYVIDVAAIGMREAARSNAFEARNVRKAE